MFGFPIGNGNSGYNDFVEKFTNNADSGFPKIQQREVFYTIKSGNWNDPNVWQTVSGRFGILPTSIDDVYIRHSIVVNIITTINNVFVSGALSVTVGVNLTFNNIRCYGSLINNGGTFRILGNENYIEKSLYQFISGSIEYQGNNQPILDLNYGNLTLSSSGTKYLIQDLFVNGTFTLTSPAIFDAYGYNITIYGSTSITSLMNATGSGSYLFVGNAAFSTSSGINLSGNPSMEFRGGLGFGTGSYTNNLGTGNILFSTNNQSITSGTSGLFFNNPISIASGITLTFPSNTTTTFNSTINGLGALSKLVNSGGSNLVFTTQSGCENLMSTGIYDFTTSANTITFGGNYSATIPSYFTTFHNLNIQGSGTKTLSTNTILNGNLSITARGYLECSTFNLTINGTTGINESSTCTTTGISKNGAGNIIFVGALSTGGGGCGNSNTLNFSGNPNVEFRNGGTINGLTLVSGTGTYKFSTNNQSIGFASNTINGPIVIEGNITLTLGGLNRINNSINGTTASSTLNNIGSLYFKNPAYLTAMSTGVFTFNVSSTSVIGYEFNGDATIPYGSFQGLYITGTGTKSASQNITCNQAFTISAGTLQLGTYDLTCNSTSTITSASTLKKSGAGNILFVGVMSNGGGPLNSFDLGGNPNVEFMSANTWNTTGFSGSGSGTGQWKFTATGTIFNAFAIPFTCSILVSGNITLTTSGNTIFSGVINGDTSTSTFRVGSSHTITYNNATQPMATGVLDTSTNLNTWIYGLSNQDIKGGPTTLAKQVYRNLTLNGGGTKTLQGYVSVQNTYTLTAPATLALNGYTLTNP